MLWRMLVECFSEVSHAQVLVGDCHLLLSVLGLLVLLHLEDAVMELLDCLCCLFYLIWGDHKLCYFKRDSTEPYDIV